MVIDSSAVLAVLLGEEDAFFSANVMEDALDPRMSAVSLLEVTFELPGRQ